MSSLILQNTFTFYLEDPDIEGKKKRESINFDSIVKY